MNDTAQFLIAYCERLLSTCQVLHYFVRFHSSFTRIAQKYNFQSYQDDETNFYGLF